MAAARTKIHLRRGDQVEVIRGAHRGASGKVLHVDRAAGRATVEGVNLVKKHIKRNQDQPQGAIVDREAGLAISNLRVRERAGGRRKDKS